MEQEEQCFVYLLTYSKTWVTHENISDLTSYSNTLVQGINRIKIEPIHKFEDEERSDTISVQQCTYCTNKYNDAKELLLHMKLCNEKLGSSGMEKKYCRSA